MWLAIGLIVLVVGGLIFSFGKIAYLHYYKQHRLDSDNHDRDLRVFDKTFKR